MRLSVFVIGTELSKPFDFKNNTDYAEFCYYRDVFEQSNNFSRSYINEIAGGTEKNGITCISFVTKNGCEITLDIDGGFPIPETADLTVEINSLNNEALQDIVEAFEHYHETKLPFFEISWEGMCLNKKDICMIIKLYTHTPS